MVMDSNEQTDVDMRRQDERVRLLYVDIQSLHVRIDKLVREKRKAEFDLEQVYASFSWRAAGILRAIRYVLWTLPVLSIQWGQRIFLDKGLIQKARPKSSTRTEPSQSVFLSKKKTVSKISPLSEDLPEYENSLILADYETKYVGKQGEANQAWSESALNNYERGVPFADYDLRNPGIFRRQARMALDSGLDGFCYRYRDDVIDENFDGPIMNHYRNTDVDLYYCVCWSNDSVAAEQFELLKSFYLRKFIQYCSKLFDDKRYLYKESRPLVVVQGLNSEQLKLAMDIWQRWTDEEESIMPFVLSLDDPEIKELGSSKDLVSIRKSMTSGSDYFKYGLNADNVGFASSTFNNIRGFSRHGGLVFLDSWNDWNKTLVLESETAALSGLKATMKQAKLCFGQNTKSVVAIIVDGSIKTPSLRTCIANLQSLGYQSKLIVLDDTQFEISGVSSIRLRGKDRVLTWNATLLRMEQQGCHIAVSLVGMGQNLADSINARGWKACQVLCGDLSVENLRVSLQSAGLWLPKITVVCDVSLSTEDSSIKRFIFQLEKQTIVPVEVIFNGSYSGEKATSEVIPQISYCDDFRLSQSLSGEIIFLCHVETLLTKEFLNIQSRFLQNNETSAVLYPIHCLAEERGIKGRNFSRIKKVRTQNVVSFDNLKTKNILGSFQEVLVKYSDLITVYDRYQVLDEVLETQKDWILWLLLAQEGKIVKSSRQEVSSLLFRSSEEATEYEQDVRILQSYLGNEMKIIRSFDAPVWAETQQKLKLLHTVLKAGK